MTVPAVAGKSARTRRDVVQAAITCWAEDNSRSLAEVADAAGVGRTTVHRHFPTRTDLITAVDAECRGRFAAAVRRARPEEDAGLTALVRACVEITLLGPVLGLVFADNALVDPDSWDGTDGPETLGALVLRGQADGSVAADLPADWVATLVWTTLFAAWLTLQGGSATTAEVGQLLARSLRAAVRS